VLRFENITKAVAGPRARTLFRDLNFEVAAAECVAVMGESGVGKSTLLNLAAGLDRPGGGRILFDGEDITAWDDDRLAALRRRRLGFVFQAFHLLPYLDVIHNAALPLRLLGRPHADSLARAGALLEQVGLAARARDAVATLSGGEAQRVAIARALAHEPDLVLADEPTGNLDADTAAQVLDVLMSSVRARGAALLLVTHSTLAAARADRVLTLNRDGLVAA